MGQPIVHRKRNRPASRRTELVRRRGAVLSMELLFVLPIVMAIFMGMIEFGMLWSASHRVKQAATVGARVASFPGSDVSAVRHAVERALDRRALVEQYQLDVQGGECSGREVSVCVTLPMRCAAPDLLCMFGLGLGDQTLSAHVVLRKE